MPELPEVEVTRQSFVRAIEGAVVVSAHLGKPLRWPLGCAVQQLAGLVVRTVDRRGKYLLIALSRGWLLLHLGMSGSLRFATELPDAGLHDHFDLVTSLGTLRLNDPRRFGAVVYVGSLIEPVAQKLLGHLGMEPLSDGFDLAQFHAGLKLRKSSIKQVLLAGDLVVGVGNIYASEALFMARIRPTVSARSLSRPRAARLHASIREVLARAVLHGGITLRDFSSANGQAGHFQLEALVYGRTDLGCKVCATPIKKIQQGQRSTYYCPACQRR